MPPRCLVEGSAEAKLTAPMARREWTIVARGREHRIELEHGYFSARRRVVIDGSDLAIPEDEQRPFPDPGSVHPFSLDGVPCAVVIGTNGYRFFYDVVVDGVFHTTGKPVETAFLYAQVHQGGNGPPMVRHPWLGAVVFAVFAIVCSAFAVHFGLTLAARPDAPLRIPLAHSSHVPDGTWVTLEGLGPDCSVAPVRFTRRGYRLAGHDDQGVPVFVMQQGVGCTQHEATGTLHTGAGTDGAGLQRLVRAPRVRMLLTFGGPANERLGVLLCGAFALVCAPMGIAFARESRRQRRRAARLAQERASGGPGARATVVRDEPRRSG